jgi:hypothetical protein
VLQVHKELLGQRVRQGRKDHKELPAQLEPLVLMVLKGRKGLLAQLGQRGQQVRKDPVVQQERPVQ